MNKLVSTISLDRTNTIGWANTENNDYYSLLHVQVLIRTVDLETSEIHCSSCSLSQSKSS
jgi:hypothetical protein